MKIYKLYNFDPVSVGIRKNGEFCRGIEWLPSEVKQNEATERHVRGPSRGSLVCLTQLDHFHMATTCISCVYTCSKSLRTDHTYHTHILAFIRLGQFFKKFSY